ncbi:MAG: hypothetical protein QF535_21120, partial [Anaerolineales bacterium]|nr:hypothetical protein [Anaerolineales bacterium]
MSNLDQVSAAIANPSSSLETPVNQLAPAPAQTLISPGCIDEIAKDTSKKIQLNNTAESQAPETTPGQQQEEIQAATSMFASLVAGEGTSFTYTCKGEKKTYVITDFTSLYNLPSMAIQAIKIKGQHRKVIHATEIL